MLLNFGSDPSQSGWMKDGEMMRFGTPLELIFQMKLSLSTNDPRKDTIESLTSLFMKRLLEQSSEGIFEFNGKIFAVIYFVSQ